MVVGFVRDGLEGRIEFNGDDNTDSIDGTVTSLVIPFISGGDVTKDVAPEGVDTIYR
eukprot:CAMPEP_0198253570 /NCGR_PEP_ID=MMETSP1447-20131203/3983_1 /TAXON_ID=420782 /ORGANISM="Chaetoceros dichaeta, Strain CCMP1751" /LENGTH=56 /DNA_ID=CAMNT_0043939295 /DNA_START=159 /DNA_END=329 /DNA_ORIENTATION=+